MYPWKLFPSGVPPWTLWAMLAASVLHLQPDEDPSRSPLNSVPQVGAAYDGRNATRVAKLIGKVVPRRKFYEIGERPPNLRNFRALGKSKHKGELAWARPSMD
jgi:hypothetical protein